MASVLAPAELYRRMLGEAPAVEALFEFGETLPLPPDSVLQESEANAKRLAQMAGPLGEFKATTGVPANVLRSFTWLIALLNAAHRRKRWHCPHVFRTDRLSYFLLGQGMGFCGKCRNVALKRMGSFQDDGHCDVCDVECNLFWPFVLNFPLGMFQGDLCDDCHAFEQRLMEEKAG